MGWSVRVLLTVAALLIAGECVAADSRILVRWLPGPGESPDGYLVYVRQADAAVEPSPRDVVLPPLEPDGTYQWISEPLDASVSYAVSLAAYARGFESPRSNEITVPARIGPCAQREEGTVCDAGDPCVAGACTGGECSVIAGDPPAPGEALDAELVLRGRRLAGSGSFVTPTALQPGAVGASVEVLGRDQSLLYRTDVPPEAFRLRVRGPGQTYRFTGRRREPGDLRKLVLRLRDDRLTVRLRARAEAAPSADAEPLTWVVRIGTACVRQVDLICRREGRRRVCD